MKEVKELVNNIISAAQNKIAKDIVVVDMTKLPGSICQYFVICEGNSPTQVSAIAEEVMIEIKKKGEKPIAFDGVVEGRWAGIDYGTVIVHVFIPELREFYSLETLWEDAEIEHIPNID